MLAMARRRAYGLLGKRGLASDAVSANAAQEVATLKTKVDGIEKGLDKSINLLITLIKETAQGNKEQMQQAIKATNDKIVREQTWILHQNRALYGAFLSSMTLVVGAMFKNSEDIKNSLKEKADGFQKNVDDLKEDLKAAQQKNAGDLKAAPQKNADDLKAALKINLDAFGLMQNELKNLDAKLDRGRWWWISGSKP